MIEELNSLSVRAAEAYSRGLMPASKAVDELRGDVPGVTTADIRTVCQPDEWHYVQRHASKRFAWVGFFDIARIREACQDELRKYVEARKAFTAARRRLEEVTGKKNPPILLADGEVWYYMKNYGRFRPAMAEWYIDETSRIMATLAIMER